MAANDDRMSSCKLTSDCEFCLQAIFGRYISEGGSDSIKCSDEIRELVSFHLKPAYEDLFDLAEELTVEVLLEQWVTLCSQETSTFQQVIDL